MVEQNLVWTDSVSAVLDLSPMGWGLKAQFVFAIGQTLWAAYCQKILCTLHTSHVNESLVNGSLVNESRAVKVQM